MFSEWLGRNRLSLKIIKFAHFELINQLLAIYRDCCYHQTFPIGIRVGLYFPLSSGIVEQGKHARVG